jgi:hypothetical protein
MWRWLNGLRISQMIGMIAAWYDIKDQVPVDDRALLSPPDRDYAGAWAVTEKVLTVLAAEVKADSGRLVVATVSAAEQVDPDFARRSKVASARGILDLFYPDKRLYRLAGRAGFHMIPLASAMAEIAERSQKYFHGFANNEIGQGHWNHIGHDVAGQILAREICTSSLANLDGKGEGSPALSIYRHATTLPTIDRPTANAATTAASLAVEISIN